MNKQRKKLDMSIMYWIMFAIILIYCISLIVPFIWGGLTSLKGNFDFRTNVLGLPKKWKWENYKRVYEEFYVPISSSIDGKVMRRNVFIAEMIKNTLLYAVGSSFFATLVACLTSYLIIKFPYKFGKILYAVIVVVTIIPIVGSLPSSLQLTKALRIYDTIWGMWIMAANFTSIYVLVFCGAMASLPDALIEAAKIDGASNLMVLVRIILPLVKNTFFTVMLLLFVSYWNDYQTSLIYLPTHPTLSVGMYNLFMSTDSDLSWPPAKIAGCYLLFIPILILFVIFHKRLMGNLTMGGVKE